MSWGHKQYVDFVEKHAPPADRRSLLRAASMPYGVKHPRIFLTYYSMPDWLDIFSLEARLGKSPFENMIARYKLAVKKHQDKVAETLNRIASFASGQALLKEVGSTRRTLHVMPYWHYSRTMPGADYFGSTPRPLLPGESLSKVSHGTYSNDKDAYAKNAPVRDDDNDPLSEIGTGKGVNVALFFSAETWERVPDPTRPGFEADEVLFHELVHVTRMVRGLETHVAVEGRGGYGNIEEYFATVITNVYMSEKGKIRLRGLYSNELIRETKREVIIHGQVVMVITDPLPKDWSVMRDPDNFYQNPDNLTISPRALMKGFSTTQVNFYLALAHLPAVRPRFNPVKEHFGENLRPNAHVRWRPPSQCISP